MSEVITVGEPMAMFVADQVGSLDGIDHFTKYLAGAEVNVCIGLKRLGHSVSYITKLGKDPFGKYIYNYLKKEKIDTTSITFDANYPTGFQLKSKVEKGDPEVIYFRNGSAASHLNSEDILKVDFTKAKHIHITGIPLALSDTCRDAMDVLARMGQERNIPITFDPNLRPSLWSSHEEMVSTINSFAIKADFVLPGLEEGEILTGSQNPSDICDFYLNQGVKAVIVKMGPAGAYVKTASESFQVSGFPVDKVIDTVGAGDGFAVGIIDGLREGISLREAIVRANAIGAIQVMTPGDNDGLPNQMALESYLKTREII